MVQWGLVYVPAAWGLLQGLEYVSDAFQWPPQLRQAALLALLIGLPVVLVLVNTWDPTHKSRASVESTTFHETWPGHHQQLMVARKASAQHRLVRSLFNSGFGEGWALYAERVADELGLYCAGRRQSLS